jgi:hypothetical protein
MGVLFAYLFVCFSFCTVRVIRHAEKVGTYDKGEVSFDNISDLITGARESRGGDLPNLLNYPFIAKALRDVGYEGVVGMEAFSLENDELALERFRSAFAV